VRPPIPRTAPHDKRGSNKRGQRREHDEQRIQDRHYRTSPWNVTLPVSDIDVGLTICTALSLPGDKLRSAGSTGRLIATANLYTLPGDLHVTGVGMAATVVWNGRLHLPRRPTLPLSTTRRWK
jgi:hypothetical protein